jgi:hypothetical protein
MSHLSERETTIWPAPAVLAVSVAILLAGYAVLIWRGPAAAVEVRVVLAPEPAAPGQP